MKTATYLDSGVLITAWTAAKKDSQAALSVIADETRELLTSEMVRLELLPKAIYFKQKDEVAFYEEIFSRCRSLKIDEKLCVKTFEFAKDYGLSAGDAFHIAAACRLGADEFITTEIPGKAMFRVKELRVISLHAAASK